MLDELIKYDSNFDEAGFKSYIDNIFVKLFTAVMTDSLDDVKHFLSSEVRETYQKKIDDLNHQNLIQMYDELNVKTSSISNVEITDNSFIITVSLTARYLDYLLRKCLGIKLRLNLDLTTSHSLNLQQKWMQLVSFVKVRDVKSVKIVDGLKF